MSRNGRNCKGGFEITLADSIPARIRKAN